MNSGESVPATVGLVDDRRPSRGWGRLVPAMFWVAGFGTIGIASWQLLAGAEPIGPGLVALLAGLLYVGAAVGLTHNGRRMRVLAWTCISVCAGGPIIQGLLELGVPPENVWSPWARFGAEVWFASLLLPLVGLAWMWWSNPRRIVELAEGIERRR